MVAVEAIRANLMAARSSAEAGLMMLEDLFPSLASSGEERSEPPEANADAGPEIPKTFG